MRLLILSSVLSLAMAGSVLAAADAAAPAATAAKATPAKPGMMARMAAARAAKAKKPAATPMVAAPAAGAMTAKPMASTGAHRGGTPVANRSAISISCSKQADTKGLHGKDREKFRRGCMKG